MHLELKRVVYLGYWKIFGLLSSSNFKRAHKEVAGNFRLPGVAGLQYKNVVDAPLEEGVNKLSLRAKAPEIISEIERDATPFEHVMDLSVGHWHKYSGIAAFASRSHDDFRGSEESAAPKIALWAFEIQNYDGTVTLLFLHGTADGNLQGSEMENMPLDRSGSGTEQIFEYLWAQGREMNIEERLSNALTPGDVAERCIWMIGMNTEYQRMNVEALFRVHYDATVEKSRRQISPLSERSGDNRPALVSRVVIGSPILVQTLMRAAHQRAKTSNRCLRWLLKAWKNLTGAARRAP